MAAIFEARKTFRYCKIDYGEKNCLECHSEPNSLASVLSNRFNIIIPLLVSLKIMPKTVQGFSLQEVSIREARGRVDLQSPLGHTPITCPAAPWMQPCEIKLHHRNRDINTHPLTMMSRISLISYTKICRWGFSGNTPIRAEID